MKLKKVLLPLAISIAAIGLVSCKTNKGKKDESSNPDDSITPSTPTNPVDPIIPDAPVDSNTDDTGNTIPSSGGGSVLTNGSAKILSAVGTSEAAEIEFEPYQSQTNYSIYIKEASDLDYRKLGENDYYIRSGSTYKANLFGLKKGNYSLKLYASKDGNDIGDPSIANISVVAYDRSGFAHFNYEDGVGAYNDDGTLKENAKVIYVTDDNKNSVSLTIGNKTVTGIGNILNSVGQASSTGKTSKGGIANTNNGIIKDAAVANIPLDFRFVGIVSESGLYEKGTYNAGDAGKIDGLTEYDSVDYGGSVGDNGHMARMRSGKNITIEGVGDDASLDGWGIHFVAESSEPELGKSFEVRNLKFMNTPEDAIGMEGVQGVWKDAAHTSYEGDASASSDLIGSVERCWIHNNEFYSPKISSPAESDKAEGDGSCDFKRGQYFTCSYNYFEGCHKTNLVGSSDSSLQFNLTYHHNFWYMCKARGPLTRRANVHMYNNYFYGQTDYALNTRADAYIFSEYNQFYFCKSPYAVEAGAIKSYKDSVSSYISSKGSMATVVTDKSQTVSNNCKFSYRNIDYSKFDTDSSLSYIPTDDYEHQTNVTDALKVIYSKTGITKSTQINPDDVKMSDISLYNNSRVENVISKANPTLNNITAGQTVTPDKVSKTAYAFKITTPMTVTVELSGDGVLVNEAGVSMLSGSGSIILEPGTYFIQPTAIQPGNAGTLAQGTFKEVTITSVKFEEYDSTEYNQAKINEYNQAALAIPETITYSDECYNAIKKALDLYNNLGTLRDSVDFTSVSSAYSTYANLGIIAVQNAINEIGTVSQSSGPAITEARNMYNTLISRIPNAAVSNYQTLQAAEAAFEEYAVSACVDAINAIGTVTLDSKQAIEYAESLYSNLDDGQKKEVTNYSTLVSARNAYDSLAEINDVINLISVCSITSPSTIDEAYLAYNSLTAEQKSKVTNYEVLSELMPTYVDYLISLIGTVTVNSKDAIVKAETVYSNLSQEQKNQVTKYNLLVSSRETYNEILASAKECSFSIVNKKLVISNTTDFTFGSEASSSDKSATINGVEYTGGLKLNSKGSFTFTTAGTATLTIYATGSNTIKVDGTEINVVDGILNTTLSAGTHTVSKGSSESCVFYVSVS